MKEVFKKIIEKLEEQKKGNPFVYGKNDKSRDASVSRQTLDYAIEIVKQEAEKYDNGWIPVSERLPEPDEYILVSFSNFSLPDIGRYEKDADGGGAFYPGDCDKSYSSINVFVNAWMPLPEAYKESED